MHHLDITDCDFILHFEAISFYTLWFWDTESVHHVVVDVDEGVVAVVHSGDELGELFEVVSSVVRCVLACACHSDRTCIVLDV